MDLGSVQLLVHLQRLNLHIQLQFRCGALLAKALLVFAEGGEFIFLLVQLPRVAADEVPLFG